MYSSKISAGTKDYAQKTAATLQALAKIPNLPIPILQPETVIDGALIFKAGEPCLAITSDELPEEVFAEMTKIVRQKGLTPLVKYQTLGVGKIGKENFLVDPIEDSVNSIRIYCD